MDMLGIKNTYNGIEQKCVEGAERYVLRGGALNSSENMYELRLVPGTALQGDIAVLTAGSALQWTYPKPPHPPKGPPFNR